MLTVPIYQQPDETTCGPTCLHSIYQYYEKPCALSCVIDDVDQFEEGGTIGVLLANDALTKGFNATIYSYNLQIFDPTWFGLKRKLIIENLKTQLTYKKTEKLRVASEAYIRFLELGGRLRFEDLRSAIIRRYPKKIDQPVIADLSATYLYKSAREFGTDLVYDDMRGEPTGHFIVLHGYDTETREVYIADPIKTNPT